MRVAIYARVSTNDKNQNPKRQILACKNYCDLNNHQVIGTFEDYISGNTQPIIRHGFGELMKTKPEAIVVFSIDRLSRQHPSKIMHLLNQYKQAGILIISVNEPVFNMETPFAEPLQYILTWWNNYFLEKLRIDIKSGLERAKKRGKTLGRPKTKFNQYRAYKLLFEDKKTLTEVRNELGVSRSTLHRFKKVAEKNPNLFINKQQNPKSTDFGTSSDFGTNGGKNEKRTE